MPRRLSGRARMPSEEASDFEEAHSVSEDEFATPAKRRRTSQRASQSPVLSRSNGKHRKASQDRSKSPDIVELTEEEDDEVVGQQNADDDDDEDEEDEEEGYTVEKILDHRDNGKGSFEYLIRWEGYGPGDDTWEPESNCNADNLIKAYWKTVPTNKQPRKQAQKQKRKPLHKSQVSDESDSTVEDLGRARTASSQTRRAQGSRHSTGRVDDEPDVDRDATPGVESASEAGGGEKAPSLRELPTSKKYLKMASWEDQVKKIKTLERGSPNEGIMVLVVFRDSSQCWCDSEIIYQKCPQQMLRFYESKVRFRGPGPDSMSPEEES